MAKCIIHISDLHVKENLSNRVDKNQLFSTYDPEGIGLAYINRLCTFIKGELVDAELYLIITGDIADASEVAEYTSALKFITSIMSNLNIEEDKVLIIPGDHDVNRELCKDAYRNSDKTKEPYEFQSEKHSNYGTFHSQFYKEPFPYNKFIIKNLVLSNDKIIFIGINSNYKISFEGDRNGYVNYEQFEKELVEIEKEYSDYSKIALFHHNMYSNHEDKRTGQWEITNRIEIIGLLEKYQFKCIFTGNEHTLGSGFTDSFYYSESGTISNKSKHPSFKIYEVKNTGDNLSLKQYIFKCISKGDLIDFETGKWHLTRPKDGAEVEEFILKEKPKNSVKVLESIDLPTTLIESLPSVDSVQIEVKSLKKGYDSLHFQDELLKIVKTKKLYHSGHFHWSETSRSHNWIDVTKLIQNYDDLTLAKVAIADVIDKCDLKDKFNFIIGLGIEGNILATDISVKYNKPYSYLPYSYRYDEHNDFEKSLNFENNKQLKSVLIITDVVCDGRTIRKLINKRETPFFSNAESIIVISLFYTGSNTKKSTDILNTDDAKSHGVFDEKTDHEENRIQYYYVLNLKGEKCSYRNEDFREKCLIFKEGLDCVYKFYDDVRALEKKHLKLSNNDTQIDKI